MKARNLRMDELLDFRPEQGQIFLKGSRVLIENADALGTLRKDLISTLGFERAKGFLIRYGWSCGYNDAISIKEQFEWDDDLEWIYAGPVLHTLEGITRVDVEAVNISRENKRWLLKGKWINSFEAEQHLRYFGPHDAPVCWILVGYAGGYGTAFLGDRVFYKEVKCKGKGDPYCEFIGKTLEEWGDEIASELPYYEEQKINEELEAAYRRIQQQHQELQRAFAIHKKLTDLVLNGEGLQVITQTLAHIINGSVLVFDSRVHSLVTYSSHDKNQTACMQKKLKEFLKNILAVPGKRQEYNTLILQKMSLKVDFRVDNAVFPCVLAPIVVGDEILGFITAVQENNEEPKQDLIMAIEHSASVYALEIIKQRTVVDLEQQLRGDFLDSLLLGNHIKEDALVAWALRLGHDITGDHSILVMDVVSIDTHKYNSEEKVLLLKKEILQIIDSFIKVRYPSALCGKMREKFIVLLPHEERKDAKEYILEFVSCLKEKIFRRFPRISLSVGVGRMINKVSDYPESYRRAVNALDIVTVFANNDQVIFYDDLGSIALLLEAQNKDELLNFMQKKLGPLIEHDRKYSTELITTLDQYLNNNSIQKTSESAALSVSGLKYRLSRIKDLGYDLQSQQERFDLQLALKIMKIVNGNTQG